MKKFLEYENCDNEITETIYLNSNYLISYDKCIYIKIWENILILLHYLKKLKTYIFLYWYYNLMEKRYLQCNLRMTKSLEYS